MPAQQSLSGPDSPSVALSKTLPGKIFFPNSDEYAASVKAYFRAQEREIIPQAVVYPTSPDDVARVVKTLASTSGVDNQRCKFAVRGGGHTHWSGASNVNGGITVDMGKMADITVSNDRTIASIGPGAVWKDVYRKLDSMELAVVGGRAGDVGVAGLTLGGMLNLFLELKIHSWRGFC